MEQRSASGVPDSNLVTSFGYDGEVLRRFPTIRAAAVLAEGIQAADPYRSMPSSGHVKPRPSTGSEVSLACDAAAALAGQGVGARVVSAPCLERFESQPRAYREGLLRAGDAPVVAVEAGRGQSLRGLAGDRGLVYGIDRFGASAPLGALAEEFGFTPDRLAEGVRRHLEELAAS